MNATSYPPQIFEVLYIDNDTITQTRTRITPPQKWA